MSTITDDSATAQQVMSRVVSDMSAAMTCLMCALGIRLGLFARLRALGPVTSQELADDGRLDERYVREWLLGMASAGYVDVDRRSRRFGLAAGMAEVVAGGAFDMTGGYALIPALTSMVAPVSELFRTGGGLGPARYPDDLYVAMELMSASWLDTMLVHQWVPSVAGLAGRLTKGARVADVGCGAGRALLLLAQAFPRSEFVGYDSNPAMIEWARKGAGLTAAGERIRFVSGDATDALEGHFDLVTAFEVLHDAPDPHRLLRRIATAVKPDGVLLLLESRSADDPLGNTGAAATILYATSILYCLPASRGEGGPGLGTLGLPPERIREWCAAGGFRSIRTVPSASPFSQLYEIRT